MPTPTRLETLTIQEPCPMRWEELAGDERKRFCSHCSLHVHDLSAMRAQAAERLVAGRRPGERLCVTYVRGPGGRPVTLPGRPTVLRRLARGAVGLVTLLAACWSRPQDPAPQAAGQGPGCTTPEGTSGELRALGEVAAPDPTDFVMGDVALEEPIVLGRVASGD